jgi:hypothetical protein
VQSQEKRGEENWRRRGQKVREKKRDPKTGKKQKNKRRN